MVVTDILMVDTLLFVNQISAFGMAVCFSNGGLNTGPFQKVSSLFKRWFNNGYLTIGQIPNAYTKFKAEIWKSKRVKDIRVSTNTAIPRYCQKF